MSKENKPEMKKDKKKKKKKKEKKAMTKGKVMLIIILIAVVGAIAFAGVMLATGKGGPKKAELNKGAEETIFAVTTTDVVSGQITDYLNVNGDVIPDSSIDVYSDTSGKLTRLRVSLGDYVRKDQVIAEVDPSRPGMSYASNPVKAPISGTITRLPFDIGATVSPQMPVGTIGRLSNLQVRTFIPEKFISRIDKGMKSQLKFEAYPGEVFDAVVMEISPIVDEMSRTLEIKMDLVDKDDRIKAGMYAKISLITEVKEDIVRIPSDCIINRFGENFVFVMEGEDKVSKRIVSEGIRIDGISEITDGLMAGETIIYQGQTLLDNMAPVKVVRSVQPLQ